MCFYVLNYGWLFINHQWLPWSQPMITCYGCLLYHRCVDSAGTESELMETGYVLLAER